MATIDMPAEEQSDAGLVAESLAGNRDAFRKIVERYQTLICSIAYSATGSLTVSEDLAQEAFLIAWNQLSGLREHSKLRSWLCGIVRFLIGKQLRRQGLEPVHGASPLEGVSETAAAEPPPSDQMIKRGSNGGQKKGSAQLLTPLEVGTIWTRVVKKLCSDPATMTPRRDDPAMG